MKQKININYIGVVKENDGRYTSEQVEIKGSEELLVNLDAMRKNSNRTVLEMQDCFTAHFGANTKGSYGYCLPYEYDSAYCRYISLPGMITIEQHRNGKLEIAKETRKEIEERAKTNEWDASLSNEQIEREINKRITYWEEKLKENFHREAVRYIQAVDFTAITEAIKRDRKVRMLSHEYIGWKTIEHKISDDLIITINTNFGYGASSYFFLNIRYKGIDILPYSQLVTYYYAGIAEIKKCFRNYYPKRDSWALAMDFAALVGNKAKVGDLPFVCDFLKNEIDEMISRLYAINENPRGILEDIKGREVTGLCSVRCVNASEERKIKLYPEEMTIVFKASKLTAALDLIDKLQLSGSIYAPALEAIGRIKDINRLFAPELKTWMAKTRSQIEFYNSELLQHKEQLTLVEEDIKLHNDKIDAIYNNDSNPQKKKREILEEYRRKYPEFVRLEKVCNELSEKINEINSRISDYQNFAYTLQECYQRIAERGLLCA